MAKSTTNKPKTAKADTKKTADKKPAAANKTTAAKEAAPKAPAAKKAATSKPKANAGEALAQKSQEVIDTFSKMEDAKYTEIKEKLQYVQNEQKKIVELNNRKRITSEIEEELNFFNTNYNRKLNLDDIPYMYSLVDSMSELSLLKLNVEFTLLNTVIFTLYLKKNIVLYISIPLRETDLKNLEAVYDLFIDEECEVSNSKNILQVLEGAKELMRQ